MNRRDFLRGFVATAGGILVAEELTRSYFLPPSGGWQGIIIDEFYGPAGIDQASGYSLDMLIAYMHGNRFDWICREFGESDDAMRQRMMRRIMSAEV